MGGIKIIDELINKIEILYPLTVHLLFDFVEDLIWFVFPVHCCCWEELFMFIYIYVYME